MIDAFAAELQRVAGPQLAEVGRSSRPRTSSGYKGNVLDGTYQGEINNLKKWLQDRAGFMDEQLRPARRVEGPGPSPGHGRRALGARRASRSRCLRRRWNSLPTPNWSTATPAPRRASTSFPRDDTLGTTWTAVGFNDAAWPSGPLGYGYDSGDRLYRADQDRSQSQSGGARAARRPWFASRSRSRI